MRAGSHRAALGTLSAIGLLLMMTLMTPSLLESVGCGEPCERDAAAPGELPGLSARGVEMLHLLNDVFDTLTGPWPDRRPDCAGC